MPEQTVTDRNLVQSSMTSESIPMRCMSVVGGMYSETNGVTRILCDLANAMVREGTPVTVYTASCKGGTPAKHLLMPPAKCVWTTGKWLGALSYAPKLRHLIDQAMPDSDVVHTHSLWMLPNHYASKSAYRYKKPVVFTAHGIFEPWALRRSYWKKRPVAWWWQDRDLHQAACIHVNSHQEIAGVKQYGLKNPIAVVPNGVDLSPFNQMPARDAFRESFPQLHGKRVALFLSRLHPKKGLAHLIQAWKRVAADHADWHLLLAGPDNGYEAESRRAVADLMLQNSVTFTGPLQGRRKIEAYATADVFVLPSFSEGFAMAILEAMAASLPVLITPGCNFSEVLKANAGVIVNPTVASTEVGLRTLMEMSDQQRKEMGLRGRRLIEQSYTWEIIARQMIALFSWTAGRAAKPSFAC